VTLIIRAEQRPKEIQHPVVVDDGLWLKRGPVGWLAWWIWRHVIEALRVIRE